MIKRVGCVACGVFGVSSRSVRRTSLHQRTANLTTILCLCISCAHCTCLFDRIEEAHPLNLRLKPRVPQCVVARETLLRLAVGHP